MPVESMPMGAATVLRPGEGGAYRPFDVDMICVHDYDFRRGRGGPMYQLI